MGYLDDQILHANSNRIQEMVLAAAGSSLDT